MPETTSRILALLSLLQTHRQWPGPELAARLKVTERTLRRDIERLRELGYHVAATRGVAGGYRLEAGSQLPPLLLSDEEAVTMAIGLRVAATQGLVDGEQTTLSALAKFEQVLPSALRQRVNALAGFVRPQSPRGAPVSQDLLGALALACRDRERIRFHYAAADGSESDRLVEPHALVAALQSWFFVAWDVQRENWRLFRVDRMSRFFGTRVHAGPRALPTADAAEFVERSLGAFRRRFSAEVVLALPIEGMRERFGTWSREASALDEGRTIWPIRGESFESMIAMLAWIPADVEYELRGSPEFLAFISASAERMRRAVRVDSPLAHTRD
jgi:predicted DNA-binding transcriptional regulator YafY